MKKKQLQESKLKKPVVVPPVVASPPVTPVTNTVTKSRQSTLPPRFQKQAAGIANKQPLNNDDEEILPAVPLTVDQGRAATPVAPASPELAPPLTFDFPALGYNNILPQVIKPLCRFLL